MYMFFSAPFAHCYLIIYQACRGLEFDDGHDVPDGTGESEQRIYRIPEMADFLYAYSTVPGMFVISIFVSDARSSEYNP